MPSFDVVSEVNMHELSNAIDQTNREVSTRFDFKGSNSRVEHRDAEISLIASAEFQIHQIFDILQNRLSKRKIDTGCLEKSDIKESNNEARQIITVRQGLDKELTRKVTKLIKESKLKVQSTIQGDQIRVTGKKRDDLQEVMAILKDANLGLPLQYQNFRD